MNNHSHILHRWLSGWRCWLCPLYFELRAPTPIVDAYQVAEAERSQRLEARLDKLNEPPVWAVRDGRAGYWTGRPAA